MPKIVDHERYRQELLSQCFALFAERGYRALTMREIAKGLGVSTGTLYHYFDSKEELFIQLMDYLSLQDTGERALTELGHPPTLAERILVVMDCVLSDEEHFRQQDLLTAEFYRHQTPEVARGNVMLREADERYVQALAKFLGIDDRPVLEFFMAWVSGLLFRRMLMGDRLDLAAQAALISKMVSGYWEQTNRDSKIREFQPVGAGDGGGDRECDVGGDRAVSVESGDGGSTGAAIGGGGGNGGDDFGGGPGAVGAGVGGGAVGGSAGLGWRSGG